MGVVGSWVHYTPIYGDKLDFRQTAWTWGSNFRQKTTSGGRADVSGDKSATIASLLMYVDFGINVLFHVCGSTPD